MELKFKGVSNYLEVLVAGIDAPRLSTLYIGFFSEIEFGTPKLIQFICRTPSLKELERARASFDFGITRSTSRHGHLTTACSAWESYAESGFTFFVSERDLYSVFTSPFDVG